MSQSKQVKPIKTNRDIRVGLVQIQGSFSGQNYLPLSVGMLQAYAQKYLEHSERYEFLLPIYCRIPVAEAVQQLLGVDVAFFSTYVWNFQISLEVARTLKVSQPETVIVFGGPHVPDNAEGFLRKYEFVDVACHGEGEQTSLAILENFSSRNWDRIAGVSFLQADGSLVRNAKGSRIDSLEAVPSPYLENVFEPLMEANPDETWIGLWETNRGCPFSCTFCDWGSAVQSKVYSFDLDRLYREVDWFAQHQIEFVFCCDANFGLLPRDIDIAKYAAKTKEAFGYPHAISVQNTKNATERAYQANKILSDAGMQKGVDLALQSTDSNTLESIKRSNISIVTYEELQRRFTKDNVETYTDIILGLPGETYDSFADGISRIIDNGQHNSIQFNNLTILPNAEMGDPEYQQKYGLRSVVTNIINIHGYVAESNQEIAETQRLVIATDAMPEADWIRTRVFSWIVSLLHSKKVLQIPFILLHELCSISYRELFEAFSEGDLASFPVLSEVRARFTDYAIGMQSGGPEYAQSEEWLNIWWPVDEYVLISLCVDNKLARFYEEVEGLLSGILRERDLDLPSDLLHHAMDLNKALIKLPFQTEDINLDVSYNIYEFWQACRRGEPIPLEHEPHSYHIDRTSVTWASWDEWCREIIWYGNKRGAYLYGSNTVEPQLSGHY